MSTASCKFIREVKTADTGGNIMCDFITLNDGTILVVSDELVALYANWDDWEAGVTVAPPSTSSLPNSILRPLTVD